MSSSLLTPSEAIAFNGFLSSVDFGDVLEWNTISSTLAEQLHPPRGKEALAKATKDLMALDQSTSSSEVNGSTISLVASDAWPGGGQPSDERNYTYGFGMHDARPRSRLQQHLNSPGDDPGPSQRPRHSPPALFPHHHSYLHNDHSAALASSAPPDAMHHDPSSSAGPSSPAARSPPPPKTTRASSSLKRSLLPDGDNPTSQSTSSKRRRPSAAAHSASPPSDPSHPPSRSKTATATAAGPPHPPDASSASNNKPPLLSPSQKRANHIQSEQKRRANIRKGYEALCEAVPALKEAIRLEDTAAAAGSAGGEDDKADKGRGSKRKRRSKGTEEAEKMDGRAGPRSENVVLQKTIDYLHTLLSEQDALVSRLSYARSQLPPNHPALAVSPAHLDDKGITPLWEREWGGGTGWAEAAAEAEGEGEAEEGGDDEDA